MSEPSRGGFTLIVVVGVVLAAVISACGGTTKQVSTTTPARTIGAGTPPTRGADKQIIPGSGLVGTWSGVVDQHGPGARSTSYPLTVQIYAKPTKYGAGVAHYPRLCGADIKIHDAGPSDLRFGFGYTLTEDSPDSCRPDAVVSATNLGDEMIWISTAVRSQASQSAALGKVNVVGILHLRGAPRLTAAEQAKMTESDLAGRWLGTAQQYGPGLQRSKVSVVMGLHAANPINSKPGWDGYVSYPSDHCAAPLYIQKPVGDSLRYMEDMPASSGCVRGGIIDMRRFGDRLLWRWSGTYHGSPIDTWAILQRSSRDPQAPEHVAAASR